MALNLKALSAALAGGQQKAETITTSMLDERKRKSLADLGQRIAAAEDLKTQAGLLASGGEGGEGQNLQLASQMYGTVAQTEEKQRIAEEKAAREQAEFEAAKKGFEAYSQWAEKALTAPEDLFMVKGIKEDALLKAKSKDDFNALTKEIGDIYSKAQDRKTAEKAQTMTGKKGEVLEQRLDLSYRSEFEKSQPIKSLLNIANPLAKATSSLNNLNKISQNPKSTASEINSARNIADQLLVVAFTKIGDETSVVMPSEFERFFGGTSTYQKVKNNLEQKIKGGLKISDDDRAQILKAITGVQAEYISNAKETYRQAQLDEQSLGTRKGFITGKIDKYMIPQPDEGYQPQVDFGGQQAIPATTPQPSISKSTQRKAVLINGKLVMQ